jgi:PST family polysaccharide transporter
MYLFYSTKFISGAELLPWFVLGIFGRVLSFPMGYILLAKGSSRWFAFTETCFSALLLYLSLTLMKYCGLVGAAYAFAILYGMHCLGMVLLSRHLTGFKWERQTLRVLVSALILILAVLILHKTLPTYAVYGGGLLLTLFSAVVSSRGIALRLGSEHRLIRALCQVPGGRLLCGI